ncbi:hypothetical protein Arub01_45290 [Actinomadura rubrobrunea]|uniref:Uncharacterized protein n=1 Tax=Actinomadura rubrobrunea TaxID=115335 RepID=A0A9W6PY94_9ACTN|nr:hypothetical protein Arub01_45290 [Actinomadura rubrobrunea]
MPCDPGDQEHSPRDRHHGTAARFDVSGARQTPNDDGPYQTCQTTANGTPSPVLACGAQVKTLHQALTGRAGGAVRLGTPALGKRASHRVSVCAPRGGLG